jgi:ATP-dependent Lhr-like helicase
MTAAELGDRLELSEFDVNLALLRIQATGTVMQGRYTPASSTADATKPEWCERRLLARIHRLTVASLRKQIEPVTAQVFMRWLLHWQHLAPGSHVSGERGLLELLRQLQGFEAPASAWERHILAPRMNGGYDPGFLDQLCLTGQIGWGRLSPHPAALEQNPPSPATTLASAETGSGRRIVPTSVAPLTFFVRDDCEWMHAHTFSATERMQSLEQCLSADARAIHDKLRSRGAQFFADLVRLTALPKAQVETALWELIAAGLVTADGYDNLRSLIDPKRRAAMDAPHVGKQRRPRNNAGRWSLLWHEDDIEPTAEQRDEAILSTCRMLLARYGVVFRELSLRESNLPKWREILICLRRMEDRGEIRGGRFVSGFLGEQFALPQAVESLRGMRARLARSSGEEITVCAADPLNLVGIIVPGDRVMAITGRKVTYRDGIAVEAMSATAQ